MRKSLIWLLVPALLILFFKWQPPLKVTQTKPIPNLTPTDSVSGKVQMRGIFVPYWAAEVKKQDLADYDVFYYFGVLPNSRGTLEPEVGFQMLSLMRDIPQENKQLVVRMLDTKVTDVILKDENAQRILATELIEILNEYSFSGLVLDIEIPFTLQPEKKGQITKIVQLICSSVKSDYKSCNMLVYGDFAYRNRPYDLIALGKEVDTILLMAYDFHKAGGEPGPNFPLNRHSVNEDGTDELDYGYDFKTMIKDASELVPPDKLEVVFGMYGYDWIMNSQGIPLRTAEALSLFEIEKMISQNQARITKRTIIGDSKEKGFEYTDGEDYSHVVWYEDNESAHLKAQNAKEAGIHRVAYWAYGYFQTMAQVEFK